MWHALNRFGAPLLSALAFVALATAGCAKDTGATCPPGSFLDSVQPFCSPCPQGTPGYVVYTAQPTAQPAGSGGGTGLGGSGARQDDAAVSAGDSFIGTADATERAGLDTIMGSLGEDVGSEPPSDATSESGDVAPGGTDSIDATGGTGGTGGVSGTGGLGGLGGLGGSAGASFPDPADATGCVCPAGFYCKLLASGATCVSYSCLNSAPQTAQPGIGGLGGGSGGSGGGAGGSDAIVGEADLGGVKVDAAVTPSEDATGPSEGPEQP